MANAPYLSFGIAAEDARLFRKSNKQHVHDAVRVAQYNVTALLHELTTGEVYAAVPEGEPGAEGGGKDKEEEENDAGDAKPPVEEGEGGAAGRAAAGMSSVADRKSVV